MIIRLNAATVHSPHHDVRWPGSSLHLLPADASLLTYLQSCHCNCDLTKPNIKMNLCIAHMLSTSSSSRMCVINHNLSARKQRFHLQSATRISRHSALSEDRIRQCETSPKSRRKDTDQCLPVAISFCRYCSVTVPCENSSVETTVTDGGQNPVAGLWGRTLGGK